MHQHDRVKIQLRTGGAAGNGQGGSSQWVCQSLCQSHANLGQSRRHELDFALVRADTRRLRRPRPELKIRVSAVDCVNRGAPLASPQVVLGFQDAYLSAARRMLADAKQATTPEDSAGYSTAAIAPACAPLESRLYQELFEATLEGQFHA